MRRRPCRAWPLGCRVPQVNCPVPRRQHARAGAPPPPPRSARRLSMSMPRAVRHINEVRVLDSLYRHGTTTRADLARELRLMRSTVSHLVAGMVEQGLILESEVAGSTPGGRSGRPGQHVQLNPAHSVFIGADIGIGHMSVVALDLLGRPFRSRSVAVRSRPGAVDESIATLGTAVRAMIRQLPDAKVIRGICVTVPGLVDRDGVVLRAPVLGWNTVPVRALIAAKLKWSGVLALENDANAFAAAELYGRLPAAYADALFVYLDAGIGGGMVSQGRLLRGHSGYAGEIGHIHLGEHGFNPLAPVPGSFESYVGRDAVLARYKHHGGRAEGLEDFIAALAAQAPVARKTASEWAWWMGRGIASLVSVLDPGRIVLGGAVAALYTHAEQEVVDSIRKHLVPAPALPRIEVSRLGSEACAIGAAMILHQRLLSFDDRIVYGETNEAVGLPPD
ncbi:ROK family transcriptional regulator [Verminephrobacter aporrectodeae subsp. tuberculatae]|nr:ROK family transcriptional regulator [Verminephrobacter aporrectodeae subsp. tuberculatae]MCW5290765.1 ROK family transcriptional regulator [Verminephrobacter aporrectodeae subsp. tuberculatae]